MTAPHFQQLNGVLPPNKRLRWREALVVRDWLSGWRRDYWHLRPGTSATEAAAKVGGRPEVWLLPGFGATTRSMFPIQRRLRQLGFATRDWGLGRNDGNVPRLLPRIVEQLEEHAETGHPPVILLGWSLGGYLAREAARDCPQAVARIITMGTPVVGGPRYSVAARWYQAKGWSLDAIDRDTRERYHTPLSVPVTAFYSRQDGVVSWEVCIDHWSEQVEHIEVSATHLGMPGSAEILSRLPDCLGLETLT